MKLIIIDDEPAVRGTIRMLAKPEALGFTMVEEASDGREALKMLENTRFDVMITDMRMPGMDGIELLNTIRAEELPNTIVVSAYHDFEYMRLAMHKHAVDYLLKPIKQNELIAALRKAASGLGKQPNVTQTDRLSMLWWPITGYPKKEFFHAFDAIPLDGREGALLYIRCIGFKCVLKQKYGNSRDLMYYHIEQALAAFFDEANIKQDITVLSESAEIVVLLHGLDVSAPEFQLRIEQAIYLNSGVRSCCSLTWQMHELPHIYAAYEAMRRATGRMTWDPATDQLTTDHGLDQFPSSIRTRIRDVGEYMVQNLDTVIVSKIMKEIEVSVLEVKKPSISALEDLARAYLQGLIEGLGKAGTSLDDSMEHFDGILALNCWMSSPGSLIAWMEAIGKECIDQIYKVNKERSSHSMKEMLDYVEENYSLNIGLDDLSKEFHMSREHISRMFKKEIGENFVAYLTRHRMKKAAMLLCEAEYGLQMVAETVGYKDASYFSRSFKKYYGVSPESYRRKTT